LTDKIGPLGMQTDDRYRIIPEERIIEMLMLIGCAYEVESGEAQKISSEALLGWIRTGLNFKRGTNGERLFDPAEVYNFIKLAGIEGRDNFLPQRYHSTYRRLVVDLEKPRPTDGPNGERRLVVEFKRKFNLQSIDPGSQLRLRIPTPRIDDFLTDLQVTPFEDPAQPAEFHHSPGRLEARMVTTGAAEVIVGAKFSFTSRPQMPCPGQAHERPDAIYLGVREGLIVVTERVRAMAQSLAGVNAPPLEAVKAFWEYMNKEMMFGNLHYDQIDLTSPCDWVLEAGWMDCHLASALLVALCRGYGIPARLLYGHNLFQKVPTNHHWIEAWIDGQGWTPFDLMDWDLSPAGCDLELRDLFFGRLNYRMTIERRPREFTGTLGVPIPENW
jgi:transglutaminase-like putative cysteine protease